MFLGRCSCAILVTMSKRCMGRCWISSKVVQVEFEALQGNTHELLHAHIRLDGMLNVTMCFLRHWIHVVASGLFVDEDRRSNKTAQSK
jgi:hypothetical protein